MGPFLLILLTFDASTGSPLSSVVIGDPYPSAEACNIAAIGHGPRKTADGKASVMYCEDASHRYARKGKPSAAPPRSIRSAAAPHPGAS